MGRSIHRLSALTVKHASAPGYYPDGAGLYLQVSQSGTKSWIFRYTREKRTREMGLGPLHTISLSEGRLKATEQRKLLLDGLDPIEARSAAKVQAKLAAAKTMSFDNCAKVYIDAHRASWRNAKHAAQWESTLRSYATPIFGDIPVQNIDTTLVMKAVEPIWVEKPETASRVRGRIESILNWATVRGFRTGDNPARWRGHLDHLLPNHTKIRKVEHHPALPYTGVADFMTELVNQEGIAARALEFLILTAARTGEAIGATWSEFDLTNKTWTIGAERMKAHKEHRIPLSPRALQIIEGMQTIATGGEFVFPGRQECKSLSNMAMLALLKRMGRINLTTHGFRSTFRDWTAECTNYPREVAEMALAHSVGDKVEAAYRRGDLFEKRYHLMTDWAQYCSSARDSAAKFVVFPNNT